MTWMHYGQLAWHEPIWLILTIWLSNVRFMPLIYIPVLLTKWCLRPIIIFFAGRKYYTPLGALCKPIVAVIDQSNAAMPFVINAYVALWTAPSNQCNYVTKYQVLIQHPWVNCMCVLCLQVSMPHQWFCLCMHLLIAHFISCILYYYEFLVCLGSYLIYFILFACLITISVQLHMICMPCEVRSIFVYHMSITFQALLLCGLLLYKVVLVYSNIW